MSTLKDVFLKKSVQVGCLYNRICFDRFFVKFDTKKYEKTNFGKKSFQK